MVRQHLHDLTSRSGATTPSRFERSSSRADALEDGVTFEVPVGYRLAMTGPPTIECACACGWTVAVGTLSGMPAALREHLFQYHQDWHTKQRAGTRSAASAQRP